MSQKKQQIFLRIEFRINGSRSTLDNQTKIEVIKRQGKHKLWHMNEALKNRECHGQGAAPLRAPFERTWSKEHRQSTTSSCHTFSRIGCSADRGHDSQPVTEHDGVTRGGLCLQRKGPLNKDPFLVGSPSTWLRRTQGRSVDEALLSHPPSFPPSFHRCNCYIIVLRLFPLSPAHTSRILHRCPSEDIYFPNISLVHLILFQYLLCKGSDTHMVFE